MSKVPLSDPLLRALRGAARAEQHKSAHTRSALRGAAWAAAHPNQAKAAKDKRRSGRTYAKTSFRYARLINRLRLAAGGIVLTSELGEAIWGDDENGGPLTAENTISVMICHLRKDGFPIVTHAGFGFSYGWSEWQVLAFGVENCETSQHTLRIVLNADHRSREAGRSRGMAEDDWLRSRVPELQLG